MQLAVGEVILGKQRLFSGFITDLTARVKMEHELLHAQKMEAVGQLTGGVAHDFNNLLTVISGNLEMLERRLKTPNDLEILKELRRRRNWRRARQSPACFRSPPALAAEADDVNALVTGMTDLLRRSLGATIGVETRLAGNLPRIMTDPGQVENALLNLAVNARDAMPNGGLLVIESARAVIDADYTAAFPDVVPGSYVTLSVTDTGTGMTPEVRQRAFEPFYTTKGPGAGSGLGLSMVYGFVKQSGGHIQLYSEVGHGTTVRLYLPSLDEGAAPPRSVSSAAAVKAAKGEMILVVEDDARVRRVSVRRLKELGYRVIEADSGPRH
jgi:signal transduction histidine kinase